MSNQVPGLAVGRSVHFVMDNEEAMGLHRPAIILRVWDSYGMVNLQVFPDYSNDGKDGPFWATSVPFDELNKEPYTWHFIERVE